MARGRYTVVRKIAQGGMAEIFLATQHGAEGFQRPVVLKRILSELSDDPTFCNGLIDEAHIAMGLTHSNIVQVLDLGKSYKRYFLVMELVDGWDLNQLVRRARDTGVQLPPSLALYITAEVCRALSYAHGKRSQGKAMGIVHRDVSPHNILISEQGEVKLTDFGIAKALVKRDKTASNIVKGKVAFMSPEQAGGEQVDARSDLFSLGSTLYAVVVGKRPFEASSELDMMIRVRSACFEPPEKVRPDLEPGLCHIITKAMKLSPAERYQTADEMLGDAERVLRTAMGGSGQTELKHWLAGLSAKDGIAAAGKSSPPVVNEVAAGENSDGIDIELEDAEAVEGRPQPPPLPPPLPPDALLDPKARSDAPVPPRSASRVWLLIAAVALCCGAYAAARSARWTPPGWMRFLAPPSGGVTASLGPPVAPPATVSGADVDASFAVLDASSDGGEDAASPETGSMASPDTGPMAGTDTGPMAGTDTGPMAGTDTGSMARPVDGGGPTDADLGGDAAIGGEDASIRAVIELAPDAGPDPREETAAIAPSPTLDAGSAAPTEPTAEPPPAEPDVPSTQAKAPAESVPSPQVAPTGRTGDGLVPVRLVTDPPGATVRIEKKSYGPTPIRIRFRPAITYELHFTKDGWNPEKRLLFVSGRADQQVVVKLGRTNEPAKKASSPPAPAPAPRLTGESGRRGAPAPAP